MAEFEYRGIGPQDATVEGRITAVDHDNANELLERMQIRVSQLHAIEVEREPKTKPISLDDFTMLNNQIIAMVNAGVPLEDGFRQMAYDLARPRVKKLVAKIAEDLASGTPLEEAIRKHQQAFPTLYARIIGIGMQTGKLAVVLTGLNRHLEFMGSMRRIIWEALNYPLVVLLFGLGVLYFTTQMIGPGMREIFMDFGTEMPGLTYLALAFGDNLVWLFPTFAIVVVITFIVLRATRGPRARRIKEAIMLNMPVSGTMLKNCLVARFTQALSLMVRVGIPLEESVVMAGEATGSSAIAADSQRIHDALVRGESVRQALQVGCILPRFLGQTMQVAMDRNQLQECLDELSQLYDQRAKQGLSTLRAILLPISIVVLASTIGVYIFALFLPLVKLIGAISG